MSFQDVKKRQHPIFDNHRYSKPEPVGSRNVVQDRSQTSSPSRTKPNDVPDQRRPQSPFLCSQNHSSHSSSHLNHSRRKSIGHHHQDHSTKEKSVRPRLTTACPVTQKNLLHDEQSTSTNETQSAESSSDEQSLELPRTERMHTKSQTRFAHLNSTIVNFQVCIGCLRMHLGFTTSG